jgi:hypothetical protein
MMRLDSRHISGPAAEPTEHAPVGCLSAAHLLNLVAAHLPRVTPFA